MKAVHTQFRKGQKIFIILRSGEKIVEKYKESKSHYVLCEGAKYNLKDVRSITIYKRNASCAMKKK